MEIEHDELQTTAGHREVGLITTNIDILRYKLFNGGFNRSKLGHREFIFEGTLYILLSVFQRYKMTAWQVHNLSKSR